MDVVIDAEQVALQLHESVGHPTELDRVLGFEAAYAGTSFLQPDDCGSLRYGSEHMNVTSDPTTPGGLGTFAFDDEGVPARAAADRPRGRARRLARLARGRLPRLDARRRLEPHAARAHDEPPPRARRGDARGADRRRRARASTSRRTRAGRSTTSGSTSSSARRSRGRSSTASSAGCSATRRTRASRRSSGARWTRSAGRDEWRLHGLTNCGKGQPGQIGARLARHVRRPASAACRSAFARETRSSVAGPRARARGRRGRRGGGARPLGALGPRALRRLDAAPADARRRHRRHACARSATAASASRSRTGRATTACARSRRAPPTPPSALRADPDFPGLAAAGRRRPTVDGYDEETAALGPDEQARLAAAAIAATGDTPAYGFFTSGVDGARGRRRRRASRRASA